jgi:hypothetical protein
METPQAIPQPATVEPQTPDQFLPWFPDDALATAAPLAQERRSRAPAARSRPPAETVHWSIVLLTMATAASVLLGSYAVRAARPRELLPVMVVTPAR